MLSAVGSIDTHISTYQWYNINNRINHFLEYLAIHLDDKLTYNKIDMHIWVHKGASYLSEQKSISRSGGYHYFSNKPKLPIQYEYPPPKHNHPVLFICKVIDSVIISTQESETGGGYINAKEALQIHQTAIEMGHPMVPTLLKFESKCAHIILKSLLKQNHLKVWT